MWSLVSAFVSFFFFFLFFVLFLFLTIDHCLIQAAHKASLACRMERKLQLVNSGKIFNLKQTAMPLPTLDMNRDKLLRLLFEDEVNHDWVLLYPDMIKRALKLARNFTAESRGVRMTSADDYERIVFRFFVERVKANVPPVSLLLISVFFLSFLCLFCSPYWRFIVSYSRR